MEKDIIKSYVRYLKLQRNMSPNTLDAYQRDLQKLLDYLDHEEKDARDVTLVMTILRNCWSRPRSVSICLKY